MRIGLPRVVLAVIVAATVALSGAAASAACGDGTLDPLEACDDANLIDGDGCDSNCTVTACGYE